MRTGLNIIGKVTATGRAKFHPTLLIATIESTTARCHQSKLNLHAVVKPIGAYDTPRFLDRQLCRSAAYKKQKSRPLGGPLIQHTRLALGVERDAEALGVDCTSHLSVGRVFFDTARCGEIIWSFLTRKCESAVLSN